MFREHPQFSPPQETDIRIWRYLDFTKFVSLLDRQALFFARSHKLNDPFEGSYARANRRQRSVPNDELPDRVYKQGQSGKDIRKNTLINSWHMNEQESAAMWQLYLKSDEGVAIQSTYRRLTESFHATKEDVFVGIVKYIDYNRDMMPFILSCTNVNTSSMKVSFGPWCSCQMSMRRSWREKGGSMCRWIWTGLLRPSISPPLRSGGSKPWWSRSWKNMLLRKE